MARVRSAIMSLGPRWLFSRPPIRTAGLQLLGIYRRAQQRLRQPRVVVYYYEMQFQRKAHALSDLLRRRNFDIRIVAGLSLASRVRLKSSPDLWIGFWNSVPSRLLPENYIVMNAEPVSIGKARHDIDEILQRMKNARAVWDYSKTNMDRIAELGVSAQFVPFGYAPYYETAFQQHTRGKDLKKDIDVLFFGAMSPRRRACLDQLEERKMKVHVLHIGNAVYGEKLDELLARSKIVLGIHYYDEPRAQIADLARIDHLLSNQLFVLHEKPSEFGRYTAFEENVETCDYGDIPDRCVYFLSHPQERDRNAKRAHEWFKSVYPMDAFLPYEQLRGVLKAL